ncbi:MAG: glycosyltransferase family 2 protein [Nitrososphaera sp.]
MTIKHIVKKIIRADPDSRRVDASNAMQKIRGNPQELQLTGFLQMYNESESGNLSRCLAHLDGICDDIVIYDDGSTDDSVSIAREFTRNIIASDSNDFGREIFHKQQLLDLAVSLKPGWIVWLDADEVFDREGELGGIRALCQYGLEHNIDGFSLLEYNLWKSEKHYRVDELWLKNWQVRLWRNNGKLRYDLKEGLHNKMYPAGMESIYRSNIKVIHYGFSSEEKVNSKHALYMSHGQTGKWLERIKDETGLVLNKCSVDWFPLSMLKITVVCLIYRSIGYANFVLESFRTHTRGAGKNVEFLFVANDPTDELLNYLQGNKIQHLSFRNKDPNEYYINRVYRAWNYGGSSAPGDIIIFVNSDMAFSDGWLENLLRNLREDRIVTSRLVESGRLRSGKYGIERDFGRTHTQFDDAAFQGFAKKISANVIKEGGLFMPCAIYKDLFIKSGGYPIGNRTESDGRIKSGDFIFFYENLESAGITHYTVFDSIVYHIQKGEMG